MRNKNLIQSVDVLPEPFEIGKTYYIRINSTYTRLQVFGYFGDTTAVNIISIISSSYFTIPEGCTGLIIRLNIASGSTVSEEIITPVVLNARTNENLTDIIKDHIDKAMIPKSATPYVSNNTLTVGDILEPGYYVLSTTWTLTDAPEAGYMTGLQVERMNNSDRFVRQTIFNTSLAGASRHTWQRINDINGTWSDWYRIVDSHVLSSYELNEGSLSTQYTSCDDVDKNSIVFVSYSSGSGVYIPDYPYPASG